MNENNKFYKTCLQECLKDTEQKKVIENNTNTIIKAGPGSGKTRVLTIKAAKLLFENINYPRGLACITYTNKAAQELKNRLNLYGIKQRKNLFVNTIHKFCINNILYMFPTLIKDYDILKCAINKNNNSLWQKFFVHFGITSKSEQNEIKILLKEYKYFTYKNQVKVDEYYSYYVKLFQDDNSLNFDLVLDIANNLLDNEYVCKCIEAKFPYILIDEYQDSSIAMHSLFLKLMHKTHIVFYIVGDPNQSIYSFTASSPQYYNELFSSPNFEKVEFLTNYRTHNNIFSVIKNLIQKTDEIPSIREDTSCYFKICDNLEAQINYIISDILPKLQSKQILLKDICILYRDYNTENILKNILDNNNIDYIDNNKKYVDKDFKESDIVIFIEDLILWILGREKSNKELSYKTIFDEFLKVFYLNKILSQDFKKELKVILYSVLSSISSPQTMLVKDFWEILNEKLKIKSLIEKNNDKELIALNNLLSKTTTYTIENFANAIDSENSVRILSAHSSKGSEFKAVIIPDMEEGRYPSWKSITQEQIKEEKRLLFVATTRAKDYLFILASGFYYSNNHKYNKGVSRFFKEIKPMFLECDEFI